MSLLSKIGFGKSQSEQDAIRRRQIEESEENELRRFAVAVPNHKGPDLLHALRLSNIHFQRPPPGGTNMNAPTSSTEPSAASSSPLSGGGTHLEELVNEVCNSNATSKTLPIRLVRALLSRFHTHFAEPATRLPVALEALHTALSASPQNAKRFIDEGLAGVLKRTLDMSLDELELRSQRPGQQPSATASERSPQSSSGTAMISESPPDGPPSRTRQRGRAVMQPLSPPIGGLEGPNGASALIIPCESPLLRVARLTLRCLALLTDNSLIAAATLSGSNKGSADSPSFMSSFFRSSGSSNQAKPSPSSSAADGTSVKPKKRTPIGGTLTSVLPASSSTQSAAGANANTTAKPPQGPTTTTTAVSQMMERLLDDQPDLGVAIVRCFGLQCRCSLLSRSPPDRRSAQEIFSLTMRLVTLLVYEGFDYVITELGEGCGVIMARLQSSLRAEQEPSESTSATDAGDSLSQCKVLLSDAGRALQVLAECIQLWPVEAAEVLGQATMFPDLYSSALRAIVQSPVVGGASAPSENDAAREAIDHFLLDTYSDRHWRDMYDSLQSDTVSLVPSPKVDSHVVVWFEGLTLLQHALRIAQDKIRHAIYTKELLPNHMEDHLRILETLETTSLLCGFTTSATEVSPRYVRRPSSAGATGDSVMHRWLLLQALALLPLHPQQIKPSERSRVQAVHRLVRVGGLLEFFFGDALSGWSNPQRNVQRLGILYLLARYILLPEEQVAIAAPSASPATQPTSPSSRSSSVSAVPIPTSSSTSVSPIAVAIHVCLESVEHYGQLMSSWPLESIEAAVVPLCGLLRWALVAREQGAMDLVILDNALGVLESCATAVARTVDALAAHGVADSHTTSRLRRCGESILESTLDTIEFLLRRRPLLQSQLEKDPSALIQLMLHPSARLRASELVQMLLTYQPGGSIASPLTTNGSHAMPTDASWETEASYFQRMSLLVSDLWDVASNSREIPDEVYLALLHCVRCSVDRALECSPFHQEKLQFALCNPRFAPDCFLRLVHPLNAGWHSLDRNTGRAAVLATLTTLIRANPVQRDRFHSTVGGEPLVRSVITTSSTGPSLTRDVVQELMGLIFEDTWSYDASGSLVVLPRNVSVQNERLLEALLHAFQRELHNLSQASPTGVAISNGEPVGPGSSKVDHELSQEALTVTGDALMCLLERLKQSFRHCRSSVWACAKAHAFEHMVSIMSYLRDPHLITAMESCLSLLTARHIDILQLKRLLGVIAHAPHQGFRRQLVPSVVEVLHSACHTHLSTRGEPKNYIALRARSGPTGVSIAVPQFPKSGFTVSLWVRWEGCNDGTNLHESTTLLSICEPSGGPTVLQICVNQDGSLRLKKSVPHTAGRGNTASKGGDDATSSALTPTAASDGGDQSMQVLEGHQIHPHQWMHLCFAHKTSMFGSGELIAFVNGKELRPVKADVPLHASGAMSIVIGSTSETLNGMVWASPLHGQVHAIYLFSKPFAAAEAHGMFLLGANYSTCFLQSERMHVTAQSYILYDNAIGERVVVCVDPRLSEKGKLFNAAFVSKAASVRAAGSSMVAGVGFSTSSRALSTAAGVHVRLHEGAFTCHTSSIIDTTCSLGALQSLILPLLVMQVNSQLPISNKSLTIDINCLLPEPNTALRDTLKLLDSLIIVDLVRAEAISIGTFPIVAHVLEKLGNRVGTDIPQRLGKICCSVSEWNEIFRVSFHAFFLSYSLFAACGHDTRRAFVDTMRSMSKLAGVRSAMRELGIVRHLTHLIVSCCATPSHDDSVLRDVLFSLLDTMMVEPVQKTDAESLFVLIAAAGTKIEHHSVSHVILSRTRSMLLNRPKELVSALGRLQAVSVLTPLLKHDHGSVRCEATRIICHLLRFSRAAQQGFISPGSSSSGTSNHSSSSGGSRHRKGSSELCPEEDLSLTIIADWLRTRPFDVETYVSLRCAACGSNAPVHASLSVAPALFDPAQHTQDSNSLVFAPVLVPILMLAKDSSKEMRHQVLSDVLSLVVSSDTLAWQSLMRLEGWFILILDVMLAEEVHPDGDAFFAQYQRMVQPEENELDVTISALIPSTSLVIESAGGAHPNDGESELAATSSHSPSPRRSGHGSVLEVGIQLLGAVFGSAACSPSHDLEDLDLLFAYILHIRFDEHVRLIAHALHATILNHVALKAGGFSESQNRTSIAAAVFVPNGTAANNAASPHRQAALLSAPAVERNLQHLFYSLEDQFFFGHDIAQSRSTGRLAVDGFVHVALDEIADYDEGKSHVFVTGSLSPDRGECVAVDGQLAPAATSSQDSSAPSTHLMTILKSEVFSAAPSQSLYSADFAALSGSPSLAIPSSSMAPQSTSFSAPLGLRCEWLHADLSLQAMQFVSSSVALVNNVAVSANFSNESMHRRGGIQRIYLRILKTATIIMASENDFIEAALMTAKAFQSLLDRTSATGFFSGRRSAADVQEDPALRSALSLILIYHDLLEARRANLTRGGSGGRNRYINQRIIERLKSSIQDNLPILKELGAFQRPTAAHLDSTHRVALKTMEWLESPNCSDVDEYFEISRRDDYQRLMQLLMDVVRTHEDAMTARVRDTAVRCYSNSLPRGQQLLKRLVMSRQLMVERLDATISSEESQKGTTRLMELVLGDATSIKVSQSLMTASWARFVARLKGTIWDMDPYEKGVRFVKLSRVEQRPLQHLKLIRDREGTDHSGITNAGKKEDEAAAEARKKVLRLRRHLSQDAASTPTAGDDDGDDDADGGETDTAGGDETATTALSESEADELASLASFASKTSPNDGSPSVITVPAEFSHLMHCWSCTVVVSETSLTVILDDENKAYNQPVAKEAQPYLLRPRSVVSWNLQDVIRIAPARRFRMRRAAMEIYFRDRSSILIHLMQTETMRTVTQAIKRGALLGQMRSSGNTTAYFVEPVYVQNENPRRELAIQKVTEMWRNREMCNMDYLLALNALAGRTVNDLTQYPVFPWILADYTSDVLDLTKKSTFRDLTVPVGLCGGPSRRDEIQMRYQEMKSMGDVPFHYFTHYSSPAVVLYFLVRLEPFTTCQILLQGGRFDHADRMFHSVAASWAGVTKNIQDVKEMIPECYYMPEVYMNNNGVTFGVKQDGQAMSHATLPPWANGDPYTLVYSMREALESDHVSSQLHHWIDLVFGFKQRGKHAVEALNLFHPHTYELEQAGDSAGGADVVGVMQPEERNMVVDSLDNIGQTPVQLFVKRHPERKPNLAINPILDPASFGFRGFSLASLSVDRIAVVRLFSNERLVVIGANGSAFVFRWTRSTVAAKREATPGRRLDGVMKKFEDLRAATISFDMEMSPEYRLPPLPFGCMPSAFPADGRCLAGEVGRSKSGLFASPTVAPTTPGRGSDATDEPPYAPCSWRNTCTLRIDDALFCVYSGFFDNSCVIRALNAPCDELRFSSHRDRVLCLAASEDSRYLVTGGRDTTFIVWNVAFKQKIAIQVLYSICGHEDEPTVCAVSNALDVVVTASQDGQWMIHALSTGKLEHCSKHPDGRSVDFILLQPQCYVPNMLIASKSDYTVYQFSVNAVLLRTITLTGRLVHWAPSGDPAQTAMVVAPANVTSTEPSSVMFYHSFFLTQTNRITPIPAGPHGPEGSTTPTHGASSSFGSNSGSLTADTWTTVIDCLPSSPQQMITGTANGQLVLIRTELK